MRHYLLASLIMAAACNVASDNAADPSTATGTDTTDGNNAGKTTIDDPNAPTTIASDAGTVDVPAGALPPGAKLSLTAVESPAEFAAATGGENVVASDSVVLTIENEQGEPIKAAQPLALKIAYRSGSGLFAAEPATTDLACLLLDALGQLAFWRANGLEIDEAAKTVVIHTDTGGTYQLVFAPAGPIAGFESAAMLSPPPSTDKPMECKDGKVSIEPKLAGPEALAPLRKAAEACYCKPGMAKAACDAAVKPALSGAVCVDKKAADALDGPGVKKFLDDAKSVVAKACPKDEPGADGGGGTEAGSDSSDDGGTEAGLDSADEGGAGGGGGDGDGTADSGTADGGGGGGDTGTTLADAPACDQSKKCEHYVGKYLPGNYANYEVLCPNNGGTWVPHTGCPAGALVVCKLKAGTNFDRNIYYYADMTWPDAAAAEANCLGLDDSAWEAAN
jgi:hypothetical protein